MSINALNFIGELFTIPTALSFILKPTKKKIVNLLSEFKWKPSAHQTVLHIKILVMYCTLFPNLKKI